MRRVDVVSDIDMQEVCSWARIGGAIARLSFNHVAARRKADQSLVTEADEQIERALVERTAMRYLDHGIIGEEGTRHHIDREFVWAVDPLDGTSAFVAGLPLWGISIGILRRGAPYAGVVYLPLLDDFYWAGPSSGAFLNDQPIHVAPPRPEQSDDWLAVPSNMHRRFTIDFCGKTRSLGCTSASLCYVARGSALGALLANSAIWDIAAGLAILQAAGGTVLTLSGQSFDPATMLDGGPLPEPVVIAEKSWGEKLRASIGRR
jgi:myo-inositol-1(or 4)-monophosphatase